MSETRTSVWPWLFSIVGSICGTVITLLLASSPTLNMVGATVGAAVPQLMGAAGSLWHLRVSIGIGITVAAIGFTFLGFTAVDAIEGVPGRTFPPVIPVADANMSVDPSAVECGPVQCPSVTVQSTGPGPLHITGLQIEDDSAGALTVDEQSCVDRWLATGESCVIRLSRTGAQPERDQSSRLVIRQNLAASVTSIAVRVPRHNDSNGTDCDHAVEGAVRACEGDLGIEVNPAPLLCDAAGCPAVTVTGIGSAPLHVTNVEIEEDPAGVLDVDQACADVRLGTGESCQITISRTGVAVTEELRARLVVHQNFQGPATFVDVVVPGDGVVADIEPPLGIRVGPAPLLCEAQCPAVTVTSTGSASLHVTEVEIEQDPDGVLEVGGGCVDQWLGTGESCQITVSRTGVAVTGELRARLAIHQNFQGPATYLDVRVVGAGPGGLSISPDPVECSAESCPSATARNEGTTRVQITEVKIQDDPTQALIVDSSCVGSSLGPGESCPISITRTDVAVDGDFQARLMVANDADDSIASVPIRIGGSPASGYDLVASASNLTCRFTPSSTPGKGGRLGVGFGFELVGGDFSDLPGPVSIRGTSKSGYATEYQQKPGADAVSVAEFEVPATDLGSTQQISITVDPSDVIDETDEGNNTVVVTVILPSAEQIPTTGSVGCGD